MLREKPQHVVIVKGRRSIAHQSADDPAAQRPE